MKNRKVTFALTAIWVIHPIFPCASLVADRTPNSPDSSGHAIRRALDTGLRDRFPEYVGLFQPGPPGVVTLMHTPASENALKQMLTFAYGTQTHFGPIYLREVAEDDWIHGTLRSFSIPRRLRESWKKAWKKQNDQKRNEALSLIMGVMFPGLQLHFEYPPQANIRWEVIAHVGLTPKSVTQMSLKYPKIEFCPDHPNEQ